MRKLYFQSALFVILTVYLSPVLSGVEHEGSLDVSTTKVPNSTLSQLRCWQYGKLLFEENGFKLPTENQNKQDITHFVGAQGMGDLYLADFKGVTCLMRQPSTD